MKRYLNKQIKNTYKLAKILKVVESNDTKVESTMTNMKLDIDYHWINLIQQHFPSIEKIVANPRSFIVDNNYVVNVEKAKRISANSVKYLTQHTRDISRFEHGDVIPKRVLTTEFDDNLAIYENRFIVTLIDFIYSFINTRARDIFSKNILEDSRDIVYNTKIQVDDKTNVDYKMLVKVTSQNDSELKKKNGELIKKIDDLLKRVRLLKESAFYQEVSKAKPVYPPIKLTNLLKSNIDYNACFSLYMYLSSYREDGYNFTFLKKNLPLDEKYIKDLKRICVLSVNNIVENDKANEDIYDSMKKRIVKAKKVLVKRKFDNENLEKLNEKLEEVIDGAVGEFFRREMEKCAKIARKKGADEDTYDNTKDLIKVYKKINSVVERMEDEIYERYLISSKVSKKGKSRDDYRNEKLFIKEAERKKFALFKGLKNLSVLEIRKKEALNKIEIKKIKDKMIEAEMKKKLREQQKLEEKLALQDKKEKERKNKEKLRLKAQADKEKEKARIKREKEREKARMAKEMEKQKLAQKNNK